MPDTQLTVLQVNTQDDGGGAAKVAWDLHRRSLHLGHDSWFSVGTRRSDDPRTVVIPNEAHRSRTARLLRRMASHLDQGKQRVRGAWRAARLLERLAEPARHRARKAGLEDFGHPGSWSVLDLPPRQPHVLHLHNLHGGYFDLRALPLLSSRQPTFVTMHDAWLLAGHCAHSLDCDRWQHGCGACPQLSLYQAIERDGSADNWRIKQDIYRQSRLHVAAPCQWLMDRAQRSILSEAIVDTRVIPHGIDLSIFHPDDRAKARLKLGLPQDARIVLFAAAGIRQSPWKDYATMREAIGRASTACGHRQVLFLALGEEGQEERLGEATIRFVPYQRDPRVVARFFQAADIYLHASRADTFPNSVIEALACGCPCVASDVGGIPEQIQHGRDGFLAPVGDAEALAAPLVALLKDDAIRRTMGLAGAARARRMFDLSKQTQVYLDWYHSELDHRRMPLPRLAA